MTGPRTLIRCPQCRLLPGDAGCARCWGEGWVTPITMAEHLAALHAAWRAFVVEIARSVGWR